MGFDLPRSARHLVTGLLVAAAAQAEVAHGIEYAGAFPAPARWYSLSLSKVGGTYAAQHMALVLLPMEAEPTAASVVALAETARARLNSSFCAEVDLGATLEPGALTPAVNASRPGCYELHLDSSWATSSFRIDNGAAHTHLVLFTEHLLSEFRASAAIDGAVRDSAGGSVYYEVELDVHELAGEVYEEVPEAARPWGEAIGAALLTCAATLSGVILLAPGISFVAKKWADSFEAILTAFAAGALLSAAFNLLLYEATHLIATGTESENETTWRWGACVLGGFATSGAIDIFASALAHSSAKRASSRARRRTAKDGTETPSVESLGDHAHAHGEGCGGEEGGCTHEHGHGGADSSEGSEDDAHAPQHEHGHAAHALQGQEAVRGLRVGQVQLDVKEVDEVKEMPPCSHGHVHPHALVRSKTVRYRVLGGVLIGDAMHNLCDGVFMGAAFLTCGVSFGWSVAGASIAHEVAQEISDYVVLTSPHQVQCKTTSLLTS